MTFVVKAVIKRKFSFGRYYGNGQKCRYIAEIYVHIDDLYAIHFIEREIRLSKSPHYQFIQQFLANGSFNLDYVNYQRRQYGLNDYQLAHRLDTFCELINLYKFQEIKFVPLLRIDHKQRIVIVDGFHRMAITFFFNRENIIKGKLTI